MALIYFFLLNISRIKVFNVSRYFMIILIYDSISLSIWILFIYLGPKLEADALSISQQKSVTSLLEMLVVLGILPNLLPGVGIPVIKRSDFLQIMFKVCILRLFLVFIAERGKRMLLFIIITPKKEREPSPC